MTRVRIRACVFLVYFLALLGYLAWHPENELFHWLTLVAIPLTILRFMRREPSGLPSLRETLRAAGFDRPPRAWGVVAALLVGILLSALQLAGRNGNALQELLHSRRVFWLWPLSFGLMLLTAAATEEFFFRGVLQKRLSLALKNRWAAVGVASLCFALYHVPYAYHVAAWGAQGDWGAAFQAAFATGLPLGVLLGAVFVIAGESAPASILAHALINSLPGMLIVQRFLES